jgi:FAD/FMN-containing dehydrogenase
MNEYWIKKYLKKRTFSTCNYAQSFLSRRGVKSDAILSLKKMNKVEVVDDLEGWVKIRGEPNVEEVNSALEAKGLELPIDGPNDIPYIDLIHLNAYGFSALKYGTMQHWLSSLSAITGAGHDITINTGIVPNAHVKNVMK